MPVLDAKALKTDRKGLAFLRAVLSDGRTRDVEERKGATSAVSKRSVPSDRVNFNR